MAISFAGSPGDLFNRLGKLGLAIKQFKTYQTAQLTNFTDTTNGIVAQYNSESDIQAVMGDNYIQLLDSGASSLGSVMQQMADDTVNRVVYRDNPQLGQTLTQENTLASIGEIIRQMLVQGQSVLAMTVAATPGSFTGIGNGAVVASVRRPVDGRVLENAFAETLTLTCVADSYVGGATEGNESFIVTGAGAQNNFFSFNWPLGSNCSLGVSAVDAASDNSNGNLLTNSDWADFTANVPDNWELVTGTAGTNIAQETSIVFGGTSALRLIGDGSTLTQIRQPFDDSDGTSGGIEPLTQYSFCVWLRRDGTAPAAGVLTIDLADDSGVVINDALGTANSTSVTLSGLSTVYTAYNVAFRTPLVLPEASYIRLRLSTALTNGRTVYAARGALGVMSQCYTSGPYVNIHSGSTPFQAGKIPADYATVAVTNSRGAAGTLSTFQTLILQLFPSLILSNEIIFPSSSSPTISDALIA